MITKFTSHCRAMRKAAYRVVLTYPQTEVTYTSWTYWMDLNELIAACQSRYRRSTDYLRQQGAS